MTLLIPLADLIDPQAETARLTKEIEKLRRGLAQTEAKLDNSQFIERAPAEVVDKERTRHDEALAAIGRLEGQLVKVKAMGG